MSGFGRRGRRGGVQGQPRRDGRPAVELLGGRYRLIEQLGAGGMSVVWRGHDEVLDRRVAVKVLNSRLASDRAFRQRIRVEARAVARLCHPHITGVYDYGEDVTGDLTVPYVVMELIDGESLQDRLARDGILPWRTAVVICAEVASALAAAHARGVVHRDVTPGNVMLTATGAKVVDFGISALVGEQDVGPDGNLLGTPAYLAPERLDGAPVSPATDVYAVGLLLYRTLTGGTPWQVSTTTEILRAHRYTEPAPLPPLPGLPGEVADLCRRCLAKTATERPGSVEVARVLFNAAGGHAFAPTGPPPAAGSGTTGPVEAGTATLPAQTAGYQLPRPPATAGPERAPADRPGRTRAGRRLAQAVAVGVGLVAVTALLWSNVGQAPGGSGEELASRPGMAIRQPTGCTVEYAVRRDSGRTFDAELTIRNTGPTRRDWQLRFVFPADQVVTAVRAADWRQRGQEVLLGPTTAGTALRSGASVRIGISGDYTDGNPPPAEFRLGGEVCQALVSGVSDASTAPRQRTATSRPDGYEVGRRQEATADDAVGGGNGHGDRKGGRWQGSKWPGDGQKKGERKKGWD